ncbi:OB-fold nucleic acid binding domain-containing protein [Cylindrospermopsis raciborskii DSH]
MLKNYITSPHLPLLLFVTLTGLIWGFGKTYKPVLSQAVVYSGESFSSDSVGTLVISRGLVKSSYRSSQGMHFLTLTGSAGEYRASFFPSLGKLPFSPKRGDTVEIVGLLSIYDNKSQVSPLSSQSITKTSGTDSEYSSNFNSSPNSYPTVKVKELSDYMEKTVWIKSLRPVSSEEFTSRKGYKMLRFKLESDSGDSISGVFFEGDWNQETLNILSSNGSIDILAKVTEFQNEISLNAKQVKRN